MYDSSVLRTRVKAGTAQYIPPKGYSKPRNAIKGKTFCQKCGSSEHWTYECTQSKDDTPVIRQDSNAADSDLPPPDSRNPLVRHSRRDIADYYSPEELEAVRSKLRSDVLKELVEKYPDSEEDSGSEPEFEENVMPTPLRDS